MDDWGPKYTTWEHLYEEENKHAECNDSKRMVNAAGKDISESEVNGRLTRKDLIKEKYHQEYKDKSGLICRLLSTIEKTPLKIAVTGAAGQISYSLLCQIGSGSVFGRDQPVIMHLLDITPMMGVLHGVVMEIQDCALPLVKDVIYTDTADNAFEDIDVAFLLGAMPGGDGMEKKDILAANVKIFKSQGEALDRFAKKSVKVVVVGSPANTNALICSHYAPSIPKENISSLTRLDQNRAASQLARKAGAEVEDVKRITIWGSSQNSKQFPDIKHALINGKAASEAINDDEWIRTKFVKNIQNRCDDVIAARKLFSALSAAKATCDHMRNWFHGTPDDDWVSMGVFSDGSYGTPPGVVFSFPVTIHSGKWSIVQCLDLSAITQENIAENGKELCMERDEVLTHCVS